MKPDSKKSVSIFLNDENASILESPFRAKKREYTPTVIKKLIQDEINVEDELEIFEGSLVKKQKSGFCRLIYKSGLFIEGIFRSGNLEGEGIMIFPNGIEYSGMFKRGILEGPGTASINGLAHKGKFQKGIFHGDYVYTNPNNQHFVFESKQEKLILIGTVDIYLSNGFALKQVKFDKNKLLNGNCTLVDDLGINFKGRLKISGGLNQYVF